MQIVQFYIAISVAHWVSCSATLGPARPPSRRPSNRNHPLPVPISTDNVYGLVSLIFWSMMIIVTLTLVMRAGNDGGGKSWRSSRCCAGTAGHGVVAPP